MTGSDVRGVTRAPSAQIWGPLVALWLIWGSTYLGISIMGRSLPPLMGNSLRFAAAGVVMAVIIGLAKGWRSLVVTRAQLRSMAIMGVMLLAVGIGTVALAERYVPSGIVALLVAVMPLWIIVFRVRAGERPAALTLAGVALGMAGLAFMVMPGGTTPIAGSDTDVVVWSLAVLASSFCWALFSWRSSRYDLPSSPLVVTAYEMLIAGAALMLAGAAAGERLHPDLVSGQAWLACAYLALASLAGYSAYMWLLGNAPLSLTSTYAYVNPVVAVFLGWLVIGEAISRDVIVGLTVVVGGVALVVTGERRR
ncbi:MAG: EamA family transporter [Actinomycetota bacterium]|nr:EamA family transporter [Actinomycetota bacterium]